MSIVPVVLELRSLEAAPEPLFHWPSRRRLRRNGQERLLLRLSGTPIRISCKFSFTSGVQAASLWQTYSSLPRLALTLRGQDGRDQEQAEETLHGCCVDAQHWEVDRVSLTAAAHKTVETSLVPPATHDAGCPPRRETLKYDGAETEAESPPYCTCFLLASVLLISSLA